MAKPTWTPAILAALLLNCGTNAASSDTLPSSSDSAMDATSTTTASTAGASSSTTAGPEDGSTTQSSDSGPDSTDSTGDPSSSTGTTENPGTDGFTRRVFVTSHMYNGKLDYEGQTQGPMGKDMGRADSRCQQAASDAGFDKGRKFSAWISGTLMTNSGPKHRFDTTFRGDFVNISASGQILIAKGWRDLTNATLINSISFDENGDAVPTGAIVWTNTDADGSPSSNSHCSGWTTNDSTMNGKVGKANRKDGGWTLTGYNQCSSTARLYCFEGEPKDGP